jgi:hypothetical protein
MKNAILTVVAVAGLSASAFAQGTIAVDNLNGRGDIHATSFGLFFDENGAQYGGNLTLDILGGPSSTSLQAVGHFNMISFGGGVFVDPSGTAFAVPGVALSGIATLQVQAWRGAATSYATAGAFDQFQAWNGQAFVDARTFTFTQPTGGGGAPPALPVSLDGMPAMALVVPEPSTIALAGLGAAALLMYRRRKA